LKIIGVVDTTFARYDMGRAAIDELRSNGIGFTISRYTVPGIKDIPVACEILFKEGADIIIALGMPGKMPVDKISAQTASNGIMLVQTKWGRHIIEVFVHEDEAKDEKELAWLMEMRSREHARNVLILLFNREKMTENAGGGLRQGFPDVGSLEAPLSGGRRH
jgi:riboflavin synthase